MAGENPFLRPKPIVLQPNPFAVKADARADQAQARQARNDAIANRNKSEEIRLAREKFEFGKSQATQENSRKQFPPIDRQKLATFRALENQIFDFEREFERGAGATKGLRGVSDFLPSEQNARLDAKAAGLNSIGYSAFRVPGTGSDTDADAKRFMAANTPNRYEFDSAAPAKIANIRNRLISAYNQYGIKPLPRPKVEEGVDAILRRHGVK
jgi:hypothetical protein